MDTDFRRYVQGELAFVYQVVESRDISEEEPIQEATSECGAASYSVNGVLYIPCVVVYDDWGIPRIYEAYSHLQPSQVPFIFNMDLTSIKSSAWWSGHLSMEVDKCMGHYNSSTGKLHIPCIATEAEGTDKVFEATLQRLPFSSGLGFELDTESVKLRND